MFGKEKKFRQKKNRQTKMVLVFDDKTRKNFLKGFRKRKEERKLKGREQMQRRLMNEKKKLMNKRKNLLERHTSHQSLPPDLEEMSKKMEVVQDLPEHTVTITDISSIDLVAQGGLRLGQNKFQTDEDSDNDAENGDERDDQDRESVGESPQQSNKDVNAKLLKKTVTKRLKELGAKSGKKQKKKGRKPKRLLSKKKKHMKKRRV